MQDQFSRTQMLIGKPALDTLKGSRVAVFGVGGVGAACVEALARGGVGELSLFDNDVVSVSNINRQFVALHSTIGRRKVDVMRDRVLDVNPDATVHANCCFYDASTAPGIPLAFDYIVDCIDTVTSKLLLIESAHAQGVPIISALGAGNKLDASALEVADIYDTSVCPLARVMRTELRKRGIKHLKVVYSKEKAITPVDDMAISCRQHCICPPGTARKCTQRRQVPGSTAYVPAVAGLIIAGEVINDLTGKQPEMVQN